MHAFIVTQCILKSYEHVVMECCTQCIFKSYELVVMECCFVPEVLIANACVSLFCHPKLELNPKFTKKEDKQIQKSLKMKNFKKKS